MKPKGCFVSCIGALGGEPPSSWASVTTSYSFDSDASALADGTVEQRDIVVLPRGRRVLLDDLRFSNGSGGIINRGGPGEGGESGGNDCGPE